MRAQYPFTALLSAAALLAACGIEHRPGRPAARARAHGHERRPQLRHDRGPARHQAHGDPVRIGFRAPQELVTWSSSDTNVATVARGGLVEGRRAGRALITASWKLAHGVHHRGRAEPDNHETHLATVPRQRDQGRTAHSGWWGEVLVTGTGILQKTNGPSVERPEGRCMTGSRTRDMNAHSRRR